MQKQMQAIFILAGTAVGSGMLSLPIVLAHIGIIPSILLMLVCVFMTYISALMRTELNLHSDSRFTLELVGLRFSGKGAAYVGKISLRLLQFALLSAYIYGLSSVLVENDNTLKIIVGFGCFVLLVLATDRIISLNHKVFISLVLVIIAAVIGMVLKIDFTALPHNTNAIALPQLCIILPTLFTSFGFQGSLHSVTKFCNNDPKLIKTACFWGSLMPAILYAGWVIGVIALIFGTHPDLFARMAAKGIDVNELVQALCSISDARMVKAVVFVISVLAIVTSLIGVGLALVDDLDLSLGAFCGKGKFSKGLAKMVGSASVEGDSSADTTPAQSASAVMARRIWSAIIAVVPSLLIAIWVPNAFVKVLSFAGMILAIIAIFLPAFLLAKIKDPLKFTILNNKPILLSCVLFAVLVVACELASIIFSNT
ncbi:MAG: hypothetical protein LBF72_02890 [Holosporales bacterium]|jgi:tyrosine-specific transport protein|nr:hypothetical protein [Holosporales bacterium]